MTTLLTLKQVIERTTLSKATIYRLIKKGVFPEGKKLIPNSDKVVRWSKEEVDNWIEQSYNLQYLCKIEKKGA